MRGFQADLAEAVLAKDAALRATAASE
jgi:hypothetical protein